MAIDFLEVPGLIALGLVILGILYVGVVVVIRATIRQKRYLAKWDFLHAVEDASAREYLPQSRTERVQNVNDQTQRGDAT